MPAAEEKAFQPEGPSSRQVVHTNRHFTPYCRSEAAQPALPVIRA